MKIKNQNVILFVNKLSQYFLIYVQQKYSP